MEERLRGYMSLFASYCSEVNAVKCKEEDLQFLRANVKKISSLLSSNKCRKVLFEHESYVSDFFFALQFLNDRVLRTQIVLVLSKLVKKSTPQCRITMLIQKGITRALFQALYMEYSEETPNVELLLKIHQLLCRLGPMDKRFGIRARVSHCIPITIHLLRIQVALLNSSIRTTPNFYKQLKNLSNFNFCYSTMNSNSFQNNIKHLHTINEMLHNHRHPTHHYHYVTMPTVSSIMQHNLNIILHMIYLYISDNGKTNSYLLGRNGVVKLLIQLINLLSGLYIYRTSSIMNSLLSSSSAATTPPPPPATTTTVTRRKTTVSPTDIPEQNFIKITKNSMNDYNINENELIMNNSPVRYIIVVMASLMKGLVKSLDHNENQSFLKLLPEYGLHNNPDLMNSIISLITSKPTLIAIGVKRNIHLLRLLVNTLYYLTKYKNNAVRANNNNAVPLLLDLFLDIHRCDLQWRWIDLQKSLLSCLKLLTEINSGRKALMKSDGFHTLYAICIGYIGPDPLNRTKHVILSKIISQYKTIKSTHHNEQINPNINQYNQLHCKTRLATTTTTTTIMDTVDRTYSSLINKRLHIENVYSNKKNIDLSTCSSSISSTIKSPSSSAAATAADASSSSSTLSSYKTICRNVNQLEIDKSYIFDNDPNRIHKQYRIYSDPIKILIQICILLRRCSPRCSLPIISAENILNCLLPSNDASSASLLRRNSEPLIQKDKSTSPGKEKSNVAKSKLNQQISCSNTINPIPNLKKKSCGTSLLHKSSSIHDDDDDVTDNRKSSSQQMNPINFITNNPFIGVTSSDYSKLLLSLCNTTTTTTITTNSSSGNNNNPKVIRKKSIDDRKQLINVNNKGITTKLNQSYYYEVNSLINKRVPKITNMNSKNLHSKSINDLYTNNQVYNNSSIDTFISQSCTELANTQQLNKLCRIQKVKILRRGEDDNSNQPVKQQDFNGAKSDELPVTGGKFTSYQQISSSNTSLTSPEIFDIIEQNTQNIDGDGVDDNDEEELEDEDDNDDDEDDCANVIGHEDVTTTSQRCTFSELISSHLKFFPEWFDLPNIDERTVEKPLDMMNSVNWPYEYNYSNGNINIHPPIKDNTTLEYYYFAQRVKSLLPFKIIAYPDLIDAHGSTDCEPFYSTDQLIERYFNQQSNLSNDNMTTPSYCKSKLSQVTSAVNDNADDDVDDNDDDYDDDDDDDEEEEEKCAHLSNVHEDELIKSQYQSLSLKQIHQSQEEEEQEQRRRRRRQQQEQGQHSSTLKMKSNQLLLNSNLEYNVSDTISEVSTKSSKMNVLSSTVISTSCVQIMNNDHTVDNSSLDSTKLTSNNHQQDYHCPSSTISSSLDNFNLTNHDELLIGQFDAEKGHLEFESRFECGNLRKAIQVRQYEYDLILNPDINTTTYLQWFYFRVSNMQSNISYRFNIINCEKVDSQFNAGMQPLLFSVHESLQSHPCWRRVGSNIIYYRNYFTRPSTRKCNVDGGTYYTATFTICFPYTGDVCYLAYHYPYTYTRLLTDLNKWQNKILNQPNNIYFRIQQLTSTILSNPVPLITVTQTSDSSNESTNINNQRSYIILTCRVHPGESNSSWIIKGLIEQLLSNDNMKINELRKMFIFKIIPMLNPDGVIVGNHRCSISGKDLNRHWINPSSLIHPTIYHTKMLMELLTFCERSPYIFIDFHGHSRMKNIFLYGCSSIESWLCPDIKNPTYRGINQLEDNSYRKLADILNQLSPYFSKQSCLYIVSKAKETTARIAVWRQFNVVRSYTIEASYCGIRRKWYDNQLIPRKIQEKHQQEDNDNRTIKGKHSNESVVVIEHQIRPIDLMNFGSQLLNAFLLLSEEETTILMSNTNKTVSSISSTPSLMTSSMSLFNVSSPEHPSSSSSL
ncbi:unnamed protein product [Schistosoma mattheei]|uniref:Peptidase M14 domain-containing protein n=1 Tax=Schistosoma mattheei TaxID=31246 RepID=A0AA85ATH1_9TREM|nr:unnamed protein product [Schistosoma mattheei]